MPSELLQQQAQERKIMELTGGMLRRTVTYVKSPAARFGSSLSMILSAYHRTLAQCW
jgi:hypothetical protein